MNRRKTLQQIVSMIGVAAFLMGCLALAGAPSSSSTQPAQPTIIQPTVPSGWKASTDSSGQCQVSTPSEWEPGRDFFLAAQEPDPGPFEDKPGVFPPTGKALWDGIELPAGKHFQIRSSKVFDEFICSVWRIKAEVDFTDAEKSELEQVGQTLQWVQ